jgi:hypothetical protein
MLQRLRALLALGLGAFFVAANWIASAFCKPWAATA